MAVQGSSPSARASWASWWPVLGTSGVLLGAAAYAALAPAPSRTGLALATAAACLPYAGLLLRSPPVALRGAPAPHRPVLPLVVAAILGTAFAAGPPLLSDDVHRFLWDGRVLRAGLDPYRFPPADPALAELRDEVWRRVNHPEIPTIYPPLAQVLFGVLGGLADHPRTLQLASLGVHLAAVAAAHRALSGATDRIRGRATWLLALNPLALAETASSGHLLDALVGLLLLLVAASLAAGRFRRAAGAAAAAVGVKLVGLLALPLLVRRSPGAFAVVAALSVAFVLPVLGAGHGSDDAGGLHHYALRWRGNEGAYGLVEDAVEGATGTLLTEGALGPEAVARGFPRGRAVDPFRPFRQEKKPRLALPEDLVIGWLSRLVVVVAVLVVLLLRDRPSAGAPKTDPWRGGRALRLGVLVGLLGAPQLHPWYLLWLLPLGIVLGGRIALVWSAAVLGSYAGADAWAAHRVGAELGAFRAAEYAVVLGTLSLEVLCPYLTAGRDPTD